MLHQREHLGEHARIAEPACCHCRQTFTSELAWKVPVIILMFVAALVVAVLVRTL